jgi:hypothetical protein
MGSVMFSLVVYGLHGWVWLLLVLVPSSGVDGTQDRGEPPHMGAGAVGGSVLPVFVLPVR